MAEAAENPPSRNPLRRLYAWVLSWADHRYGAWALFGFSLAESVFFPIPPDVLLIALILARQKKAWWYAFLCTAGSLAGAAVGYGIGEATEEFWYSLFGRDVYAAAKRVWEEQGVLFVFSAAFSPIPYKIFTIAAGIFKFNFATFMLASLVGRAGRFFLVAALFYWIGPKAKPFIDRWLNWLALAFVVLIALGIWLLVAMKHSG